MTATVPRVPLDRQMEQFRIPLGQVSIIPSRCKGCKFCIDFCPEDVLVESDDMNAKGYHYAVVAPGKENACVNCRFCTLVCPEFAIFTTEIREATA